MASVVEIVNRALTKLGEKRIISLDDECKAAAEASSMFGMLRDAELTAHSWNFALTRSVLPALSEQLIYNYTYAYQWPSDCLRVIEVGESQTSDYSLEGNLILCNTRPPLFLKYIKRETNTAIYPSLFAEVLAAKLAVELAESLTSSAGKKESAQRDYQQALIRAKRINAIQKPSQILPDDSWLLARQF